VVLPAFQIKSAKSSNVLTLFNPFIISDTTEYLKSLLDAVSNRGVRALEIFCFCFGVTVLLNCIISKPVFSPLYLSS
jgi:hypothetical protein